MRATGHSSIECFKNHTLPTKCDFCAGAHTTSYGGCPVYKKLTASSNKNKMKIHLLISQPD